MEDLSTNLFLYQDTCNVYIVRSGAEAVLVDFGDGAVRSALAGIGVRRVTDILITHHHRDQVQGLFRALAEADPSLSGVRVWAPHMEQDLFHSVDAHWQGRALLNNYDVRQDRFSLLDPVPLAGTLKDYSVHSFGGRSWQVIPTPGHTPGSITLLAEIDGARTAFTGDLIAGPGKVWSLAAMQWTYHGVEGLAPAVLALLDLCERRPDRLLPSHGEIITDPEPAIDQLVNRLLAFLNARGENQRLMEWVRCPYERITPHLLINRASVSNSYVLLSRSGKALLIDYGYDFLTAFIENPAREVHRPWLYSLPALKRDFAVSKIDAVIATHYHDDHVAGFNLLREVEGAQVWAFESFAGILQRPGEVDLPCLWYDPIPVDRVMRSGQPLAWEEYTLTAYPLPGHTRYAAAIAFEVDGKRVLATGDQYKKDQGLEANYVYQNRFEITDFRAGAEFYTRCAPELILPGHWEPLWTSPAYFQSLCERGERLEQLHRDLLPLDTFDLGGEGFAARILPYHAQSAGGCPITYRVEMLNPHNQETVLRAELVLPGGWSADAPAREIRVAGGARAEVQFTVVPPAQVTGRRFRLAVDVTAGEVRLGQQAEALVDVGENRAFS